MPQYQCLVKSCWRKMPDGRTPKLYHRGNYENFKDDREAGNNFVNVDSPKKEQAEKRVALLEELQTELEVLERTKIKTPGGTMPVAPDAATKKRIKVLKTQITKLTPKEDK